MGMMKFLLLMALTLSLGANELHDAVKAVNIEKVKRALKAGADINATDEAGETPLHIAARIGRYSIVRLLLEHGPTLYLENNKGYTPLAIAISHNRIKTINAIVKAQKKQKEEIEYTDLHTAVMNNDEAAVITCITHGFKVDTPNSDGVTPLHIAAKEGLYPMARLLVEYGADVHLTDKEGRDALYYARFGNNKKLIKYIANERIKGAKK